MGGKLKVGIAGYGTVGKIRHKYCDLNPNLTVKAVCDQIYLPGTLADTEIRCYTDYHQLLAEDLDVLFVCLPNHLAPHCTIAGLKKGLHVFCEKPPGRDVEDILKVMEVEKKHPGQKLMYGFNHRYHDSVRDALRIIQSRELGDVIDLRGVYGKSKIIRFDSDWRTKRELAGGGILLDQGIHMVDMFRLFAGDFVQVHSFIANSFWNHDVEDNAYAIMRTADGKVGMLHSSATQWRHRFQLHITLTKGAITLSGILTSTKSYAPETITVIYAGENDGGDPLEQTTRYNADHSWPDEIEDFVKSIIADEPIRSGSSIEAYKTMKLVYDIYYADKDWCRRFNISGK